MATHTTIKELTNYQKMESILAHMKLILKEELCDQLLFAVNGYVSEEREKAKALVISPELQEFERLFKQYAKVTKDSKQGHGPGNKFYLDDIIKKIKEVYGS